MHFYCYLLRIGCGSFFFLSLEIGWGLFQSLSPRVRTQAEEWQPSWMLGWECSSVAVPAPAVLGRQTKKKSQIFLSGKLQPHQWGHLDWRLLNRSVNQVNYLCLHLGYAELATSAQSVQWWLPWIKELHNFFLLFLTCSALARQKNWLQSHRKYVSPPDAQWKQLKLSSDCNRISHGFSFTMNSVFVKRCIALKIITCNNYYILGFLFRRMS